MRAVNKEARPAMTTFRPSTLLRQALLADAAVSGATGLLLALGAGPLAGLLALPEGLLRYAGLVLLPFAASVAWLGTRGDPPRVAVRAVITVNALWTFESLAILLGGWVTPNMLGHAFVVAQALAVAALAAAQVVGLRRSAPAVAA